MNRYTMRLIGTGFSEPPNAAVFNGAIKVLSRYRIHRQHKTGTGGLRRWEEMCEVVRRHSPDEVVRHYQYLLACPDARWWLNKRMRLAQFFSRMLPRRR